MGEMEAVARMKRGRHGGRPSEDSQLFADGFELPIDDLSREPIDRNVQPITLFSFHHELRKVGRGWWVPPRLGNQVDHQVPGPRLAGLGKGAHDAFTSFFIAERGDGRIARQPRDQFALADHGIGRR